MPAPIKWQSSQVIITTYTLLIVGIADIIIEYTGLLFKSDKYELVCNNNRVERFTIVLAYGNPSKGGYPAHGCICYWCQCYDADDYSRWINIYREEEYDPESPPELDCRITGKVKKGSSRTKGPKKKELLRWYKKSRFDDYLLDDYLF
jgi:hypothetical protein